MDTVTRPIYRSCSSAAGAGEDSSSQHPVIADAEDSDSEFDAEQAGPLPIKSAAVPVTETLTEVQPASRLGEAAVVSDTLVPYDD